MKKILIIALVLINLISLSACSENDKGTSKEATSKEQVNNKKIQVSEDVIKLTKETMKQNTNIKDIDISIKDDTVTVTVIVSAALDKEKAKDAGEGVARNLASNVASYNKVKGPEKDYLGEIYDQYKLWVIVGDMSQNVMAKGEKITSVSKIVWIKQ